MEVLKIENDGSVTLDMNAGLYRYPSIISASKKFSESFWVAVYGDREKNIIINLKPKPGNGADLEMLGLEFYNYALGLMQES